jgi:hypothetical protein
MSDGNPGQPVTIDAKQAALDNLRRYAQWATQRDPMVCTARRAGASYDEIIDASTLSRGTVTSILTKAGLTGRHPSAMEAPVTTPTTSAEYGTSARFFPHHPHFVSIEHDCGSSYRYGFRAFTGAEPEPKTPPGPDYIPADDQTAEDKARLQEWRERVSEIGAANKLWQQARYYHQVTPLVEAALKARPPVDEALAAMQTAWEGLDNAPVWPVAVKALLDAQDAARAAMDRWVDRYAYPLAEVEGNQSNYISEYFADWHGIAEKLNGGQPVSWDVGSYHRGPYTSPSYWDNPLEDLDKTIRKQRARLEEVARYSGEREH